MHKSRLNHISLLLHLLHLLHLVELLDQLAGVVELLHRRGSGGDARTREEGSKQSRGGGWRRDYTTLRERLRFFGTFEERDL